MAPNVAFLCAPTRPVSTGRARSGTCARRAAVIVQRPRLQRPRGPWRCAAEASSGAAAKGSKDAVVIKGPSVFVPQETGLSSEPRYGLARWGEGIRRDVGRRLPSYVDDWLCGFNVKTLPVILFLFFACYAPVIGFGGLTSVITNGAQGVVEFVLATSVTGILYHVFTGQPLCIQGPTGLTFAFTQALYQFSKYTKLAFMPMYAWTGLFSGVTLMLLALSNASDLIQYCTPFTDDVFNSLIALTFIYEAAKNLLMGFVNAGADKTKAFMALTIALGTYFSGRALTEFRMSKYLRRGVRVFLADFGPCLAILLMTIVANIPGIRGIGLQTLSIPSTLKLAGGRPLLVNLWSIPNWARLAAIVPASLLSLLIFLDQNITVRVLNANENRLKKGDSYHYDLFVLGLITALLSVCGLPWMCAATLQTLNHHKALSEVQTVQDPNDLSAAPEQMITYVRETRVTGLAIHILVACSILMLPVLKLIPMAVISGLFLFLGRNMMSGNEFLRRIKLLFVDPNLYPANSPVRQIPPLTVHLYTGLQFACLALLWTLKQSKRFSLLFPTVILMLIVIRLTLVERVFPKPALVALDGDFEYDDTSEEAHLELYEGKSYSAP